MVTIELLSANSRTRCSFSATATVCNFLRLRICAFTAVHVNLSTSTAASSPYIQAHIIISHAMGRGKVCMRMGMCTYLLQLIEMQSCIIHLQQCVQFIFGGFQL